MEETTDHKQEEEQAISPSQQDKDMVKFKRKELGISCMLNTEVGALLAVIRRPALDSTPPYISPQDDTIDTSIIHSLKSLRALIFNPQQEWRIIDPSIYLSPFLDVIQSDDVPAAATGVALSAILKMLKMGIFDEKTPGAKDAINSIVAGIINCRMERKNHNSEFAVLTKILAVLASTMKHQASVLLTDQTVCTIVNTCFQIVQKSASRGDLLQRNARYTMQESIQIVFSRLPEIEVREGENSDSDADDTGENLDSGYGIRCAVDIFHFLCSLMNVVEVVETEGTTSHTADEDVQLFALVLINSAIELSGDDIGKHPKLLRMIQDDLFHHLIHYGMHSSELVLAVICSTVLNIYHFLRSYIRLQLEAFFRFVLLRIPLLGSTLQLQEVAVEGMINFCRQPTFIYEAYVNYDCNFTCQNIFEDIGKLLCKHAFPTTSPMTSLQIQAFEGLVIMIHNIADNINLEDKLSSDDTNTNTWVELDYKPFWEERFGDDNKSWVDLIRLSREQKRKAFIAGNHFNRDEKKGFKYLKLSKLVSDPIDPKAYAFFFRYCPGLDKDMIGDFLGDPDEFNVQVLKEFTGAFEFSGMNLDTALRFYLEAFRLPGESQKITRVLEAFSDRFYDQQPSDIFASKDAVFILCYSLIMLNTDQHNPQVKKKMTEEEFLRNNRGINAGNDLPREMLSELFYSISNNAIKLYGQTGSPIEMSPSRWIELMNRVKLVEPFFMCPFDCRLGRDMFASIAGPSVATLSACFEHADDNELLHECIEGMFSVARIAQYGLEDTLDEVIASFCKFTTLLNPYASAEETLFAFGNDMKPRMATLAVFTIANNFGYSIRGCWRNILECVLKLKRLKLLPQSVGEPDIPSASSPEYPTTARSESGVIFPSKDGGFGNQPNSGTMSRFSHFLSLESPEDNLTLGVSEFDQNLKVIKQCRVSNIFTSSSNLPDETLLNLGRQIIFAAAGKGQKFSTPVEEEETVSFCWELITTIVMANLHRFSRYWPTFHENLLTVTQFPMFSPIPFAEKAIVALLKVCLRLFSAQQLDMITEEVIFKSINLMWKLDKEILDTCCEFITKSVSRILMEYPSQLQSQLGWKTVLHLLSITGRHPETYDQGVETLIVLLSDGANVSKMNYPYCIDCAFGFVALKNSPLEKNLKILDLLADSVALLVQWYKNGFSDPGGSNYSAASTNSSSSLEDTSRGTGISNYIMSLFIKLCEALRKTSLARREDIRNHAIAALGKSFTQAEELEFTPVSSINCFNLVIFAMVDDLHEKMLEYSRRDHAEKEVRSMEGTLKNAMDFMTNVFLQFLKKMAESSGFRTFWLGVLRRTDTCMKAELGPYGECTLKDLIPDLLRRMITRMKENEILVKNENDLWDITYIQIQWIAPSLKEELFPEEA